MNTQVSTEYIAKILSQENINVLKQNIQTAYFDLENRTLVLPNWNDMEFEVEKMLTFHEVSHALYTPQDYTETIKEQPVLSDILNVLEDPRVERLFKERYPGSRKDFISGYKILREKDFFELSTLDIDNLNLIDRINLFFKCGAQSGVTFSREEIKFVKRAQETVTFEDVKQLAMDIAEFLKKEGRDKELEETCKTHAMAVASEDGEEADLEGYGDLISENYDNGLGEGSPAAEGKDVDVDKFTSLTMRSLQKKINSMTSGATVIYHEIENEDGSLDPSKYIVSYKEMLATAMYSQIGPEFKEKFNQYKTDKKKKVSHMVNIFEQKKSAEIFASRRIHKTGIIDTNKICQYQVKDNIFKKKIEVKEGKNHGFIFLLDMSGSMISQGKIFNSLNQLASLAMFCRSVNIPFRVFGFSNHYRDPQKAKLCRFRDLVLLELMSSDMSAKEFTDAMFLFRFPARLFLKYPLYNTPLAPALFVMREYLPKFKEEKRIDKLNFIVFTDGVNTDRVLKMSYGNTYEYLKDPVTKKNYHVDEKKFGSNNAVVFALYNSIRDRVGCNITTYFCGDKYDEGVRNSGFFASDSSLNEFKKNKFVCLKGNGRDAAYIIAPSLIREQYLEESDKFEGIKTDTSASGIASVMKKNLRADAKGRVLIEHFMANVS